MVLLIIGRSVENAGALQYHSIGSIPIGAFKEKLKIGVNPSRLQGPALYAELR